MKLIILILKLVTLKSDNIKCKKKAKKMKMIRRILHSSARNIPREASKTNLFSECILTIHGNLVPINYFKEAGPLKLTKSF